MTIILISHEYNDLQFLYDLYRLALACINFHRLEMTSKELHNQLFLHNVLQIFMHGPAYNLQMYCSG